MRIGKSHRNDNLRIFNENYVRLQDSVHACVHMHPGSGTRREIFPLKSSFFIVYEHKG